MEEEIKLTIIPEKLFLSRIKNLLTADTCCDKCESVVKTTFYPYGYDKEENDVWSVGICPNCGDTLYIHD